MATFQQQLLAATTHLQRRDTVLRSIIDGVGPCQLRRQRDRFRMLVHSIIAQQVSAAAARTIFSRLVERLGAAGVTPDTVARMTVDEFRAVGISRQKAAYLLDLAEHARSGRIHFDRFGRMNEEAIIAELVQVKGIGRWTAEMLLIFSLGRLDVLPVADLGIRSAMRDCYRLGELPGPAEMHEVAKPWRPYASVACWYLWRRSDLDR